MANTVQIKRGSNASVNAHTGPSGELIYNLDTGRLHAQDGSTAGGKPHALVSDVDLKANAATQVIAGDGLTGGGTLAASRTLALNSTSIASLAKADTAVQPAIAITAGTGLTGGGTLAASRTVALSGDSIASLSKADTALQAPGGSSGQILAKNSNTTNDVAWVSSEAATAVSYGPQMLTELQQVQARQNIQADHAYDTIAIAAAATVPAYANAIRLNGYYAAGDGGGGLYKRVASEPTHAGKVQSADGAWWEIVSSVVRVEQFGGFTGTDVTASAQNALDYLSYLGGGELQFTSPGTFTIGSVNVDSDTSIFVGDGVTVQHRADAVTPMFLSAGAKSGVQIPLSSDIDARATSVPVSNASSLAAGDWIILKDTADYSTDSAAIGYKSGESIRIKSISGNTLNFDRPLFGSFQPDQKYTVARGANVEKVNGKRNVRIYGPGAVRGHKNFNTGPIEMRYVDGAFVHIAHITEFGGCGVLFRTCLNWEASPKFVADGRNEVGAGFPGYGVAVWGACDVGSMHGVNVTRTRHAFTTMGSADGGSSRIRIADNIVVENDFTALDTHEGVHEVVFQGNQVYGGNAANDSGGINTRAPTSRIIDNVIIGVPGSGINAVGQSLRSILMQGNYVEDCGLNGLNVSSTVRGLRVLNNTVIRCGANGIALLGGSYDTGVSRLTVKGNTVTDYGRAVASRSGIQVVTTTASTLYMDDNTVEGINGAEGRGIYTSGASLIGSINDNTVRGTFTISPMQLNSQLIGKGNTWDKTPVTGQVAIPDDGIYFLKGASPVNIQYRISSSSQGPNQPNGIFTARTNATPQCIALTTFGANVAFTTGVLTGTTGTDGNFTISAASDGVYFENRVGGIVTINFEATTQLRT